MKEKLSILKIDSVPQLTVVVPFGAMVSFWLVSFVATGLLIILGMFLFCWAMNFL